MSFQKWVASAAVAVSMLSASGAHAADRRAVIEASKEPRASRLKAEIRVRVIHASNATKKFDPHLEDLRKFLEPQAFTSFKQVIDETLPVEVKETKGIGLLSGKNLNVTLSSLTKEKATIRLLLLGQTGQILDTTVSAGPHKLFFIAGPRYDNGVLFVAIEPHYDPDALFATDNVVKTGSDTPQPR